MTNEPPSEDVLKASLRLPCGAVLKNRLVKSPMSDSLGDGQGNPTEAQIRVYERWAQGGVALSIIGEVQVDPRYPEKPGNLVLGKYSDHTLLRKLTRVAVTEASHLWPQIGHAGALSHAPISQPRGPSALSVDGLQCDGMSVVEIRDLPRLYAQAACIAKEVGFSGVHIHAGHGVSLRRKTGFTAFVGESMVSTVTPMESYRCLPHDHMLRPVLTGKPMWIHGKSWALRRS